MTPFLFGSESYALIFLSLVGVYAGAQNVFAGGGSFITFPALMLAGLDPLSANITSTVALSPSQLTSSIAGRNLVSGVHATSFKQLFIVSLLGGGLGALLLLSTPVRVFVQIVPWLILFATIVFAWGSFGRKTEVHKNIPSYALLIIQAIVAIYGGYFGGGIGILMLALLTFAGQQIKAATATKNVLAFAMNVAAVSIFAFSPLVNWTAVLALGFGGIVGGLIGSWLLHRLPEKLVRGFIILVGTALTIWLFIR